MNKQIVLGLTLFALVMTGVYIAIFLETIVPDFEETADIIIPFVVFSGFFIFIIAAMLIALSIMELFKKRYLIKKSTGEENKTWQ